MGWQSFFLNAKAQTWLWAKSGVPDDYCSSNAIVVSPQGNVIEAGAFNGFAYFSGNTITSKGSTIGVENPYVVMYDPNGNVRWVWGGGNVSNSGISAAAIDSKGNIYVTGTYTATLVYGVFSPCSRKFSVA